MRCDGKHLGNLGVLNKTYLIYSSHHVHIAIREDLVA